MSRFADVWSWTRQRAMIVKELRALWADPRARFTLFIPPMLQLMLFSFAATLEVRNVEIGLIDQSGGAASTELVQRIAASGNFSEIHRFASHAEMREAIDHQDVLAAIVIEPDFDRKVARGEPASVGLILDGRRSNAAQIVGGYIGAIAGGLGAEMEPERVRAGGSSQVVNWFNPNLSFIWFNLPALIVVIVSISALAITGQVVAREREMGTFEQLMVSPFRVTEILIGKMAPTFIVGMGNGLLYLVAAVLVFGVPFTGSIVPFLIGLAAYNISLIGVGLAISAASKTQQQAFLGAFLATNPVMLLSGFSSPIENMPHWLQIITYADPARWFLQISLGSFLKDMPASVVFSLTWPMLVIGLVTLGFASYLFRARME